MHDPLIIVGAGRSGTNALRDALTELPGFTTWPCDEINYVWRSGNRDFPTDELLPQHATPETRRSVLKRFEKIEAANPGSVVVEKTCANSLRVGFVAAMIPNARIVHIKRDGYDVTSSAMDRWTADLDLVYLLKKARFLPYRDVPYYAYRYLSSRLARRGNSDARLSTWGPRFEGLDELVASGAPLEVICATQWSACTERADEQGRELDPARWLEIHYEDFVSDPVAVLGQVARFAGATPEMNALKTAASAISDRSVGAWRSRLSDDAVRQMEPIIGAPSDIVAGRDNT